VSERVCLHIYFVPLIGDKWAMFKQGASRDVSSGSLVAYAESVMGR
jgi:hypothetical protein